MRMCLLNVMIEEVTKCIWKDIFTKTAVFPVKGRPGLPRVRTPSAKKALVSTGESVFHTLAGFQFCDGIHNDKVMVKSDCRYLKTSHHHQIRWLSDSFWVFSLQTLSGRRLPWLLGLFVILTIRFNEWRGGTFFCRVEMKVGNIVFYRHISKVFVGFVRTFAASILECLVKLSTKNGY